MNVNENYRLTSRDINFIIEKHQIVQEGINTNPENIGMSRWCTDGYYSSFITAIDALEKKESISSEELASFISIKEKVSDAIEEFAQIEFDEDNYLNVTINGDWSLKGKNSNFQMIHRQIIQEHRFVKKENIGKDKFVSLGFTPNVGMALKTILNMELMWLISEDNTTLNDVEALIENIVQCSKHITYEKISSEAIDNEDENLDYLEA